MVLKAPHSPKNGFSPYDIICMLAAWTTKYQKYSRPPQYSGTALSAMVRKHVVNQRFISTSYAFAQGRTALLRAQEIL